MTEVQQTTPRQTMARSAHPQLKAVIARVSASLAIAVFAPAMLFWALLVTFGIDAAVITALSWLIAAMCWRWSTGRPMSALLLLTLIAMTIRTGVMLTTGNAFVYFLQPICGDAIVAAIFLLSLRTARPIVARLAPDFYPIDAALAARPRIRRLFQRLTLLWGLVIVVKAGVTLWLLMTLSTVTFVAIRSSVLIVLTVLATIATIALSAVVGRREGLLAPS